MLSGIIKSPPLGVMELVRAIPSRRVGNRFATRTRGPVRQSSIEGTEMRRREVLDVTGTFLLVAILVALGYLLVASMEKADDDSEPRNSRSDIW